MPAPPVHTPLISLPALVLDLETTGLNVRNDRVVQVGAVTVHGDSINSLPRLDQLVNPGVPIPALATSIHSITDTAVADAPRFSDIIPLLRELIGGRVVIGHHIGFDLAILRHEAGRAGIPWQDPPALDVAHLFGALRPILMDLDMETVTAALGVQVQGRHTAMGDCLATAEVWTKLLPLLREADIRTLGEAHAFAARRQDLMMQQAQAGWYAMPGEAQMPGQAISPALRIDSYAFERRLRDVMTAPPLFVSPDTTLRQAAQSMVAHKVSSLLVGHADAVPRGVITERDLLRAVAAAAPGQLDRARVTEIMSSPVETMSGDEMLYRALGRMDRLGIRHLCVADSDGIAHGMLSQRDLLQHRARSVDLLSDALVSAATAADLAAAYARVPSTASRLLSEGLNGAEIARVVSTELCAMTARATELTLARLAAEGQGAPPARWCVLVLGSGGRGDSLLGTDQDNALIHDGSEADDAWFAQLGQGIADLLDSAGVPRCKGGVMAANAAWRGTLEQWHRRVSDWLGRARPEDLLNVDIFFDLVPVAGDAELARTLHNRAVQAASTTPPFIALLAESVLSLAPRFALLGGLRSQEGRADLKRHGLLPLVSLTRTLALRIGSRSRATSERLRDVTADGRLPEQDAERLMALHAELLTLILRQQLQDIGSGITPSGRVELKPLSRKTRRRLAHELHHLAAIVHEMRSLTAG